MALMTFGCCIFYMAFAGDLFSALAGTVSSLPAVLKKRAVDLVILGLCPLLPLCLMKNLSALQVRRWCCRLLPVLVGIAQRSAHQLWPSCTHPLFSKPWCPPTLVGDGFRLVFAQNLV